MPCNSTWFQLLKMVFVWQNRSSKTKWLESGKKTIYTFCSNGFNKTKSTLLNRDHQMNPHRVILSPWQFKPDFDISLRQFFCFHETECILSGMQFIINLKFRSFMWRATHMICRRYLGWQLYNVGGRRTTRRRKIETIMSAFIPKLLKWINIGIENDDKN